MTATGVTLTFAGEQAGPRVYHGTCAPLADSIRGEGLRPGADGAVYMTTSFATAQRYAMWAAVAAAQVEGDWPAATDVGEGAKRFGDAHATEHVGVVAQVHVSASDLEREAGGLAPPLPWETTLTLGESRYLAERIPSLHVGPYTLFPVGELDDPGTLELAVREMQLVSDTFARDLTGPGREAPAADVKLPPPELALGAALQPDSPWHGVAHALGVAAAGVRLLDEGCSADPAVLLAFAMVHDARRDGEGHDPEHGAHAAAYVRGLRPDEHRLTAAQLDVLEHALTEHDQGGVSPDETVGACWDADRLTLRRLGATPDPALLSTPAGRALADRPDRIPGPDKCDWLWVMFRATLAAERFRTRPSPAATSAGRSPRPLLRGPARPGAAGFMSPAAPATLSPDHPTEGGPNDR